MPETVAARPLGDLHVHTRFSCDSRATMAAMCQRAVELGLRQVAFTEHVDYVPADAGYGFLQPAAFLAEIERCRERFAGRLTILAGVEIGEPHRFETEARPLLEDPAFDLVIGSLHWVGDELVFDPDYFRRRTMDQACQDYFRELERMCRVGGFDVLGHFDVLKRVGFQVWGRYDVDRYRPLVVPILQALVANGIALEINTSTLRRPVAEPSPSAAVLAWYRSLGGELVTFGSDAHAPQDLAAGWSAAVGLAQSAGLDGLTSFRARHRYLIPWED